MIIQHNMQAANANRMLGTIVTGQSKSTEKLSSGYRINRAGDDAAGLAISEKMRGQIRGLNKASSNAQDGISMIQTAEGALTETHSILQRMRELAVQASNDTNTDDDRTQIQNEIDQLTQEVDRIATTTEFNTKKLLDGSRQGSVNEKAGSANVDSTFANSNVSASITTDGSAKAAFTDVIRIEIMEDFEAGKSTASTKKLTDTEIDALYTAISGKIGTTNSTDEAIEAALTDGTNGATKALDDAKGEADASAKAVAANEKAVDKFVDSIMSLEKEHKAVSQSILADGVTESDVRTAVTNYVNSWIEAGQAVTDTTAVTAAEEELAKLFTSDNTTTTQITTKAANSYTYAASSAVTGTGSAATVQATDVQNAVITNGTTTLKAVGDDIVAKLETFAKAVATTAHTNTTKQTALEAAQKNVDALSDNALAHAIYDYGKAKADLAALATPTDAAKAEAQAKVDAAKATLDELNTDVSVLNVSDLFGNTADANKFAVGSAVDENNELTVTLKNKEGTDTVITISNADKLKAGDVITITSDAMVESKPAATGKEAFRLQVGANAGQEVALGINSMKAKDLNIVQTKEGIEGESLKVTTQSEASLAVKAYDMAIQKVSTERAKMGATQNRLEHTIANLDTSSENLQSAESRIRDVDMAEEMVTYSKNSILQQAAQSMLAQANQSTQGVLSLLQ